MSGLRVAATAPIRLYQRWIGPAFPAMCRFSPSCSQYALESIEKHGIGRGLRLTVQRVVRCNPYHPGGFDPVP